MKKFLTLLLVTLSINGFAQQKVTWHTDVEKAVEISVKTEKPLFLFFTGSDWCGWCKRLVSEVFQKEEFKNWAKDNVVLVELDFPKRKKLSEKLQVQNSTLQRQFGVRGYPTGYFVKPSVKNGKVKLNQVLGSQGYVRGGPNGWITGANRILNNK